MSPHAIDRLYARLGTVRGAAIAAAINQLARAWNDKDTAIRVLVLKNHEGDVSGEVLKRMSNGNEVWAVVRGGVARTVMFRRSTQPRAARSFDVARVVMVRADGSYFVAENYSTNQNR